MKHRFPGIILPVAALVAATSLVEATPTTTGPAREGTSLTVDHPVVDRLVAHLAVKMRRVQTDHYLVLYDAGQVFAESRARLAERTYKAFHGTFTEMGLSLRPLRHKLVIVVLRDKRRYVQYAAQLGYGAGRTDGFYSLEDNVVVLFDSLTDPSYRDLGRQIDTQRELVRQRQDQLRRIKGGPDTRVRLKRPGRPGRTVTRKQLARKLTADNRALRELERKLSTLATRRNAAKTMHEAAHQLSINTGVLPNSPHNPFWVSEGLACQFEVNLTASARKRGAFSHERLEAFRTARRGEHFRSLKQLLTATISPKMPHAEILGLYAQAWALFYHLRVVHPQALASYLAALAAHAGPEAAAPTARLALFTTHFGPQLRALNRDYVTAIEGLK